MDAGGGARRAVQGFSDWRGDARFKGEAINDYAAMKAAGTVAVSDDGLPILKESTMREALASAARHGLTVIQHAEDTNMTAGGR